MPYIRQYPTLSKNLERIVEGGESYLRVLLLIKLPKPISPKPTSSILRGSVRVCLTMGGADAMLAVALTQHSTINGIPTKANV